MKCEADIFRALHLEIFRAVPYSMILEDDPPKYVYPLDDNGNYLRWRIAILELQICKWWIDFSITVEGKNIRFPYFQDRASQHIPNRIRETKERMEKENREILERQQKYGI